MQTAVQNRRRFFRVYFYLPLQSKMFIEKVYGKKINTNKTIVKIHDMSAGGLRFSTDLKLPINDDIQYGFHMKVEGIDIELSGKIVWSNMLKPKHFEYGVEFVFEDHNYPQQDLLQLLNRLQTKSR